MGTRLRLAAGMLAAINLVVWAINSHYGAQLAETPMGSSSQPRWLVTARKSDDDAQSALRATGEASRLVQNVCKQLGPFDGASAASAYGNRLKSLGLNIAVQKKAVSVPAGYWLLAPVVDAAQGRALAAKLNAIPMRDWQVLRDSPYGVAVSMGLFNVRSPAELRLKQVRSVAPSALIYDKQKKQSQYWIQATGSEKLIASESGGAKMALRCNTN